jgi:hypothetical protein
MPAELMERPLLSLLALHRQLSRQKYAAIPRQAKGVPRLNNWQLFLSKLLLYQIIYTTYIYCKSPASLLVVHITCTAAVDGSTIRIFVSTS